MSRRPDSLGMAPGGSGGCVCDPTDRPDVSELSVEEAAVIWIISPALLLLIFVILVVMWILVRRPRRLAKAIAIQTPTDLVMTLEEDPEVLVPLIDPIEMRRKRQNTLNLANHPPVPVLELEKKIQSLKSGCNALFSQEYESIDPGQEHTWESSSLEVNKPKNRYANVVAYDQSRVILETLDSIPGSDYINANYCDGYRKPKAYIATQGPLSETVADFWRMVWEQNSSIIVMISRLEENNRIKCDQYWPSRGTQTYGEIYVSVAEVQEFASYFIRTFHLQRIGSSETREVTQFQSIDWPDHGVPDHPTSFLAFIRKVKANASHHTGPIAVHCSAGVGRTGCYIVIDSMLERLKQEKTIDIYGHVTCLRGQRNYMVQTEEQYIFIYDAIFEALTVGLTEIPSRNLYSHIHSLLQVRRGEKHTKMELEFKKLKIIDKRPGSFVSANLPVNQYKNRNKKVLPYETTRVCLEPIGGMDGSDYVNANYINGYRHERVYIATQGPLFNTTADFWRMLWEQNSNIIVMLTKITELEEEKCYQYWPSERSQRYLYFTVVPITEYNLPQYILREFKVTDTRSGLCKTIRQFHFNDWPERGVPKSGEGFVEFIRQVHKTKAQFGQEGPVTVHCSEGIGRTGVFTTLSTVLERMHYEGVIDIFQSVCILRTQRPGMVQTEEQYQFCYRAALEYLGSFDH